MQRFTDQARDLVNDFDELFEAFNDIVIPDFVPYISKIRNNMIQIRERYTQYKNWTNRYFGGDFLR